jgi:hypothetical protein
MNNLCYEETDRMVLALTEGLFTDFKRSYYNYFLCAFLLGLDDLTRSFAKLIIEQEVTIKYFSGMVLL